MDLSNEQWRAVLEAGLRAGATKQSVKKWPGRKTVPWKYRRRVIEDIRTRELPMPAEFFNALEAA